MKPKIWLILLAATCFSCNRLEPIIPEIISVPANPGSVTPYLSKGPSEHVYLSWQEPLDSIRTALRFSRLEDNRWSTPKTIVEGENWFVNWADYPVISSGSKAQLVSSFLKESAPGTYDYDIHLVLSHNGGKSWQQPFILNQDGINAEHGFVSMQYLPSKGTQMVWLDGRNTKNVDTLTGQSGAMTLRTALLNHEGILEDEQELDSRVCDCCQTDVTMTDEGPLVVYRDRSHQEIRDISGFRYEDHQWIPLKLPQDNWEINGCPVNGPRVVASRKKVVLAWFSAANGQPEVKWSTSNDGGEHFSEPLRIDDGSPLGRVDVVLLPDNSSVVSWLEGTDEGARLMATRLSTKGKKVFTLGLNLVSKGRESGFPQMTAHGYKVIWVWTDAASDSLKSELLTLKPI
ncbi:MAG: exo-alpha-sialidase [Cyclobacteriaceae bacterium]|nr:exo-alpha-sialidase [Cyclobacteriaceae bacterium]